MDNIIEESKLGAKGGVAKTPTEMAFDELSSGKKIKPILRNIVSFTRKMHDRALTNDEVGEICDLAVWLMGVDDDDVDNWLFQAMEQDKINIDK